MEKDTKILVTVLILSLLSVFAIFIFLKVSDRQQVTAPVAQEDTKPREIEADSKEKDVITTEDGSQKGAISKIAIEGELIAKGNFASVSEGKIYYQENGQDYVSVLNDTDIAVACTKQDLSGATELDFKMVTKVNVFQSAEIASHLPVGEPIVIFSDKNADGKLIAHTIAIASEKCD